MIRESSFLILASIALSSFGQGVWNTRTGLPSGQGRWGCATFSVNDIAYVCGGYTGTLDLSEVRAYDTNTDQWSSRASLPVTVRLASGFAINGKGYVACGLSNSSDLRNELWEYDPNQNTWTQKGFISCRWKVWNVLLRDQWHCVLRWRKYWWRNGPLYKRVLVI